MIHTSPDEIFFATETFLENEWEPKEAVENTLFIFENQAKKILTQEGYGVEDCYLTPNDPDSNRAEWLSEAYELIDYQLSFELEQAAIILIESENIRRLIKDGETGRAVLTMAKLTALTLLPKDTDLSNTINTYKNKPKEFASMPKGSVGIKHAYREIRKENPEIKPLECFKALIEMGDENQIVTVDGKDYELSTEPYDMKSGHGGTSVRLISTCDRTGNRDGRSDQGVTLPTVRRWFTNDKAIERN